MRKKAGSQSISGSTDERQRQVVGEVLREVFTKMKKSSRKLLALCLSASLCAPLLFGCGTNEKKTIGTEAVAETESSESVQKETGQAVEQTDVFVEPVDGISDDFIRGMDASAVLSVENSGMGMVLETALTESRMR